MKDIQEKVFKVSIDDQILECLCDILFNNYPDGIVVKVLEVQKIPSHNFKRDFITDLANDIHEQISNEINDNSYDEDDR